MLRGDFIALYSFLRKGNGEGGADPFIPLGSTGRTHRNGSELHQGRFRLDFRSISLPKGWSNTGTSFQERWSMSHVSVIETFEKCPY